MSNYGRWQQIKQLVFTRDDYQCRECGSESYLVAHHLDGSGDNHNQRWAGNNAIENLITLCQSCHGKLHWKLAKAKGFKNIFEYNESKK